MTILEYTLTDQYIKIGENFYIKASQFYHYSKNFGYKDPEVKIFIPGFRSLYPKFLGIVSRRFTDPIPEQIFKSVSPFFTYEISDDELSEADFVTVNTKSLMKNLKKGDDINIIKEGFPIAIKLYNGGSSKYNPLSQGDSQ